MSPSPEEVAFKHRIDEIYTAHPYYGYRRIAAQLHREGQSINQKTVARYMREMGLVALYPGPNLSKQAQRALERATPQICNSDQGSQFTSPQYTQLLLSHKVQISMDSKRRALDNTFTDRLWRTIKYEEVYVKDYASPREARHELRDYLRFYNEQRIHQAPDYQTPAEVYFARRLVNRTRLQAEGELWLPHNPLAKQQSKA